MSKMHSLKIVHRDLREDIMSYSDASQRLVWYGFDMAQCVLEDINEETVIT
jgi:hypothetical protein